MKAGELYTAAKIEYAEVHGRDHHLVLYKPKHLVKNKIRCFDVSNDKQALPESSENTVIKLLSDMVKRGLLMRIKNGVYCVIPYEEDPDQYMPEWHILPEYLITGGEYYIGFYSAMEIHNLITQPSLKEQVVVSKQVKPSTQNVKDVMFQFIYHNEKHFFGKKKMWLNSYDKVWCSDLEKTLIDCFYKPDYAGSIVEVARGLYRSKDTIDYEKLLEYVVTFDTKVVIKRLDFIVELFEIDTDIIPKLQELKTASYTVLDTELPKTGKMHSRWSIRQNLDTETITTAITT